MTKEIAETASDLLLKINDAERVLTMLDSEESVWFGPHYNVGYGVLPAESVSGARRCYQKLKEFYEAELEKL